MQDLHRYDAKTSKINKIEFTILGNKEIKNMSALGKDTPGLIVADLYDNTEPKKGGLIDPRMGITNNDLECTKCGFGTNYCPGHFGHIDLAEKVYHMGFIDHVISFLKCVCIRCSKLRVYKNEDEIAEILKNKKGKKRLSEIINMVKNISYCQRKNYDCGAPIPKIKKDVRKSTAIVNIIAEYQINVATEDNPDKKPIKEDITPEKAYNILKNISDEDCWIMGLDPSKTRPEDFIHVIYPIAPVPVRPSVRGDFSASGTREDQLTGKYAEVLKANIRLLKHKENMNDKTKKYFQEHISYLQYHIATLYDNESLDLPQSVQKGQPIKSLISRLSGKEGRIRNNLMAKRTDFSARSVITPDPMLSVNELGVPIGIAKNLTFPEIVTPHNKDYLEKLVRNGREKWPGANYVIPESSKNLIDLRYRKEKIELRYGDIVERHMQNGDIVLFNRQPTLHKQSMMGHRAKIIDNPEYCTFRLNPNVVDPYNADFDGDEMNLFFAQCVQAQIELERIADVKYQIITPKSSAPSISIKEDALAGSYNMTVDGLMLDWRTAMNVLSASKLDNYSIIQKDKNVSGKDVYSAIIPDNINSVGKAIVKNGVIEKGPIVDQTIGIKKKNNLIQLVWDEYGVDETVTFLNNITRLANTFNLYHGLTIGIGDLDVTKDIMSKIYQIIQTKKLEVMHDISEVENNPDMMDEKLFETFVKQKLTIIRDDIGKMIFNNFKPNNNIKIMLECGSKGSSENIAQMGGCLGSQDFDGYRMPKNYNKRTLPYFFQNDDSGEARGFIEGCFMNGINLSEFIFHQVTGREGCIDSALKSVTPDTTIMIMENSKSKIVKIGEWIDEHLINGYKNTPELIETKKTMNFELLNVKNMYIPTVNEDGKMSWGEITALTRHDSGNYIYEIITQSGRKVKVPESKSLLIWKDNKFIPLLTPDIKIGDKVPVTMKLSVPPIVINEINMSDYFSKKEYLYGTDFIKAKNEMENAMISDKFKLNRENGQFIGLYIADGNVCCNSSSYVQITKNNEHVLKFVENYFDKLQIHHARQSKTTDVGTSNDVRGFSKIMADFMTMIVGNGSANKRIPEFAYNAPEEFIIGLLDGYFSGDGSVDHNSIDASSSSENLIDGINILLTRLGIFAKKAVVKVPSNNNFKANYDSYAISIRGQWASQFKIKIGSLINSDKNLENIEPSKTHTNYQEIEDVILDTIITINKLDSTEYPKLYDLTVPSTLNFSLANGLGVRDTASSGYLQRKFIKATEDCMVKYDGTVRNAVERIHQFIYGDSGVDTVKQYDYKFKIMNMTNSEIANVYKFTKDELKQVEKFTESDNNKYYEMIKNMRDHLRQTQMKATIDYITLNINYMLPVNVSRIVNNVNNSKDKKDSVMKDPKFIIDLIEDILRPDKCRLYSMTEDEMTNINSPKNLDDKISKTVFRYALYDALAPKKCIFEYKFSKKQLEDIAQKIISSFNKSIVEPGEMVGILGAQSLGEPVTQMVLRTFHTSGIGANLGVPRMQEVFSLSKNIKNPNMYIYLDKENREKKDFANKIASYIKFTTIKDLRTNIKIYYDPKPYGSGSFMEKDNVYNVFYAFQQSKSCCSNKIDGLPWLMRIEFDKEKMMNKEVSLLDIKSKFCVEWEKRYQDVKGMKREKRQILDKITQIAVLTNTDNDDIPIMHIRFDMNNYNSSTLVDFMDMFIDEFKLKGLTDIQDVVEGTESEARMITFDNPNGDLETKNTENIIITNGINMSDIRNIIGVDLTRTYCNDIIMTYEMFGIEAARNLIIKEITNVFSANGSPVNHQHISIFGDLMSNVGTLTSIDRHGLNKLDNDPLARASFEKSVEQLITAAVFNEVDHMKSVSSRIMAGLCIKGGTGLCNLVLDRDLLENSEYTVDIGQLYNKTFDDIVPTQSKQEVDTEVFIPEF